jgi:hypothetical protein
MALLKVAEHFDLDILARRLEILASYARGPYSCASLRNSNHGDLQAEAAHLCRAGF